MRRFFPAGFGRFLLFFFAASVASFASLASVAIPLYAADSASLQFTVPFPDPAMAGEEVSFQVLAVNSGSQVWPKGSYFWSAEIYDVDYNFAAKTEEISPQEDIQPGAVAAAILKFNIPENYLGKRLYRIFLSKDGKRLIESEYKLFQITEKKIKEEAPPPPEKYKIGGDISVTYKNSNLRQWKDHSGATTANIIGKVAESSFLFNAYLLHKNARLIDPYIILLNYYAPWGIIGAGDLSPSVSPLSVQGQGMRGGTLEQQKGRFGWIVFGGKTVNAQPGSLTTNGRYERQMYGVKGTVNLRQNLKISSNYVLSSDNMHSLNTNPASDNYTGPGLTPQKNPVYGASMGWEPFNRFSLTSDYQVSQFYPDVVSNVAARKGSAWRGEARWDGRIIKAKTSMQRTDPEFAAFSSPMAVADRMTVDWSLSVYPVKWLSFSALMNRYKDNLDNDPAKVATTQNQMTFANSIMAPTRTVFNVSYSVNSAVGNPSAVQNNQTDTIGFGLSQPFKSHNINAGYQMTKFTDKNKLAHDIDSAMMSLSAVLNPFKNFSCSMGAVMSISKDIIDSRENRSNSYTASFSRQMPKRRMAVQVWGTYSSNQTGVSITPSEAGVMAVNTELAWAKSDQSTLTFGVGRNESSDTGNPSRNFREITVTMRYGYSF